MTRRSNSVLRATMMIDLLVAHPTATFGLSELASRLGVNKATCLAIATSLCDRSYLLKDALRRYSLGPALAVAGEATLAFPGLEATRAAASWLAAEFDAGCLIMARCGDQVVALYSTGDFGPFEVVASPGLRGVFEAPFAGVLVAWSSAAVYDTWVGPVEGRTPEERAALREMVTVIRARGFGVTVENPSIVGFREVIEASLTRPTEDGLAAAESRLAHGVATHEYALNTIEPAATYRGYTISSAVIDRDGKGTLAVLVGGFRWPLTGAEIFAVGDGLVRAVDEVSAGIGGRRPSARTDLDPRGDPARPSAAMGVRPGPCRRHVRGTSTSVARIRPGPAGQQVVDRIEVRDGEVERPALGPAERARDVVPAGARRSVVDVAVGPEGGTVTAPGSPPRCRRGRRGQAVGTRGGRPDAGRSERAVGVTGELQQPLAVGLGDDGRRPPPA